MIKTVRCPKCRRLVDIDLSCLDISLDCNCWDALYLCEHCEENFGIRIDVEINVSAVGIE